LGKLYNTEGSFTNSIRVYADLTLKSSLIESSGGGSAAGAPPVDTVLVEVYYNTLMKSAISSVS